MFQFSGRRVLSSQPIIGSRNYLPPVPRPWATPGVSGNDPRSDFRSSSSGRPTVPWSQPAMLTHQTVQPNHFNIKRKAEDVSKGQRFKRRLINCDEMPVPSWKISADKPCPPKFLSGGLISGNRHFPSVPNTLAVGQMQAAGVTPKSVN